MACVSLGGNGWRSVLKSDQYGMLGSRTCKLFFVVADSFQREITLDWGTGRDNELIVEEKALGFIIFDQLNGISLRIETPGFAQGEIEIFRRMLRKS